MLKPLHRLPASIGTLGLMSLAVLGTPAHAVPSYARQTGMECAGCHVGAFGPQLTPAGIQFKLGGYTDMDGKSGKVPLSAMVVAAFARTRAPQDPAPDHLKTNNNTTLDEASVFLAGRLADHVGSFAQVTYDGIGHSTALDQVDVRAAGTVKLGGVDTLLGVSLNNNPSVQDPFNTLPAWGYPYKSPAAGFGTGAAASLLNGGLAQRVIGASAYAFMNQSVYAELGSYRSLSSSLQSKLGAGPDTQRLGGNAYWRLAYFKDLKTRNYSLGLFGWNARLAPDRLAADTQDHYADAGIDGSYQFLGTREHMVTINGSWLRERKLEAATGDTSRLREQRLNASYHFNQTWGASAGWFNTTGSASDASTLGRLVQIDWTPWGKEDSETPVLWSPLNLRLGAQYWMYSRFEGERAGATDHNTLHLFAWTSF
ncbi:hypothetical protein [Sphaerotilus sp.]|uniref:hypothetical protein n=1 Tax=Sphaerotilus sp. TaxID=2093942 RepID=UPI0034E2084B